MDGNTNIKGLKLRRLTLPNSSGNLHHALHTWGTAVSNMALDCDVVVADLPPKILYLYRAFKTNENMIIPVGLSSLEWEATFPYRKVISTFSENQETKGIIVPSRIHPQKNLPRENNRSIAPQWKLSSVSLRSDFQRALGDWIGKTAQKVSSSRTG